MVKNCATCGLTFEITENDFQLLEKISPVINEQRFPLPPPSLCPSCRFQRRIAMRNQSTLYRRTCALTGKPMVSLYSEDKPYTVYAESVWGSDAWDSMEYGRDIDFQKTFFDQFAALMLVVPRRGMHQDGTAENSDYTAFGMNNKNCYLSFSCGLCEDVYYCSWTVMAKNCIDCLVCISSELLYQCIDCATCYHCSFCQESTNCQDSILLQDCQNCHHCICCKNLRNKEYHLYNKPVSKEEFEKKRKEILEDGFSHAAKEFDRWKITLPTLAARITKSEDCTGNYIEQSKHCLNCFDLHLGSEDLCYCQLAGWQAKDMMDCTSAGKNAELLYEMHGVLNGAQHSACVSFCVNCQYIYYCENMKNSSHCFGCVGLTNKQHCIFNKQYTEQEYNELVPRLIEKMQADHCWGEFFPIEKSPFCYNETLAQEHFPLTKEQVLAKGWQWKDVTGDPIKVAKTIKGSELPESIAVVKDDVLDYAIVCEATGKPFRIIKQELDFYRREGLPIPHLHPEERHRRRMALRTPYKLWTRQCQCCKKEVQTSYAPDRPESIYCEECYLKAVY